MISGGADSACAAAGLAGLLGAGRRPRPPRQLRAARGRRRRRARLPRALRRPAHRPPRRAARRAAPGNLQAAAREARYAAAERLRAPKRRRRIVTGHTRTDLVETVLYRLAGRPGRGRCWASPRAAAGWCGRCWARAPRMRALADAAGAALRRRRDQRGPALRPQPDPGRGPARCCARSTPRPSETSPRPGPSWPRTPRCSSASCSRRSSDGAGAGGGRGRRGAIAGCEPGLRRLALRALAERAAGGRWRSAARRAAEILRLARARGRRGRPRRRAAGRLRERARRLRDVAPGRAAPAPVALSVPGARTARGWEVRAELHPAPVEPPGPELATLDAAALAGPVEVRTWREGDRMQPLGMEGTKTLRRPVRGGRHPALGAAPLPVVTVAGEVAWIAGVASASASALERVRETARRRSAGPRAPAASALTDVGARHGALQSA